MATPADIRGVIRYLKKRPGGVIADYASNPVFDARKVASYKMMGIIVNEGGKLQLSPLGLELAQGIEDSIHAFRVLLRNTEPYKAALDRIYHKAFPQVSASDIIQFWSARYPEFCNAGDVKLNQEMVECFFQLCQEAALGYLYGKREQELMYLYPERQEITAFVEDTDYPHQSVSGINFANNAQGLTAKSPAPDERRLFSLRQQSDGPNIALKILSLALLSEIEALGEQSSNDEYAIDFAEEVRRFETALIRSALIRTGGRQRRAARLLNMTKSTLNAKITRYRITLDAGDEPAST